MVLNGLGALINSISQRKWHIAISGQAQLTLTKHNFRTKEALKKGLLEEATSERLM